MNPFPAWRGITRHLPDSRMTPVVLFIGVVAIPFIFGA